MFAAKRLVIAFGVGTLCLTSVVGQAHIYNNYPGGVGTVINNEYSTRQTNYNVRSDRVVFDCRRHGECKVNQSGSEVNSQFNGYVEEVYQTDYGKDRDQ